MFICFLSRTRRNWGPAFHMVGMGTFGLICMIITRRGATEITTVSKSLMSVPESMQYHFVSSSCHIQNIALPAFTHLINSFKTAGDLATLICCYLFNWLLTNSVRLFLSVHLVTLIMPICMPASSDYTRLLFQLSWLISLDCLNFSSYWAITRGHLTVAS